jgi:hypothetical protein
MGIPVGVGMAVETGDARRTVGGAGPGLLVDDELDVVHFLDGFVAGEAVLLLGFFCMRAVRADETTDGEDDREQPADGATLGWGHRVLWS